MNNQKILAKKYTKYNFLLTIIFCALLIWIAYLLYQKQQFRHTFIQQIESITQIKVLNKNNSNQLTLIKADNNWQITHPIKQIASNNVINTLLGKLQTTCNPVQPKEANELIKKTLFPLVMETNNYQYQFSQQNIIPNKIYAIKQSINTDNNKPLFLVCDSLVSIILNSPAINFVDKSLYKGALIKITTDKGSIEPFNGLDLSVLQVIKPSSPPNLNKLKTLIFKTNHQSNRYYLLPLDHNSNNTHLFLYSQERQLIFVIAKHTKLSHIIN